MYAHELRTFFNTVKGKDGERKVLLYDPKNDGNHKDITDYPTLEYEGIEGPNGEIIFTVIHSK